MKENGYTLPSEINLCPNIALKKGDSCTVTYQVYANEDSNITPMPLNPNVDGKVTIYELKVTKDEQSS